MTKNILILCTSASGFPTSNLATGSWYEEVASPYYIFKNEGYEVTVASVEGGAVPFDPASASGDFCTPTAQKFIDDPEAQKAVQNSLKISDVDVSKFDALYLPGGHGVVVDMPQNAHVQKAISSVFESGRVVGAVCHGPAALVGATANGEPIVKGRKVAGFTNSEEEAVQKTHLVPFLLEDKLKELGGDYQKIEDWGSFAVADGNLVTGQNPQSSEEVAKKMVAALS